MDTTGGSSSPLSKRLYASFDTNRNKGVSLAEALKGVRGALGCPRLSSAFTKPIVLAFKQEATEGGGNTRHKKCGWKSRKHSKKTVTPKEDRCKHWRRGGRGGGAGRISAGRFPSFLNKLLRQFETHVEERERRDGRGDGAGNGVGNGVGKGEGWSARSSRRARAEGGECTAQHHDCWA